MRRRSGALHSEDYEGYLQLCKSSQSKLGVFYNESPKKKGVLRRMLSHPGDTLPVTDLLNDFQFDRSKEWVQEQQKLSDLSVTPISVMVMMLDGMGSCQGTPFPQDHPLAGFHEQLLLNRETFPSSSIDLLIRNIIRVGDNDLVVKVWICYQPYLPIFKMYYKSIDTFFLVQGQSGHQLAHLIAQAKEGREFTVTPVKGLNDPIFQHRLQQLCESNGMHGRTAQS